MFKNLNNFNFESEVNRKQIKIRFTREGHEGVAYTLVQLYNTVVVRRQNVNNITTLNSGGYRTMSTKRVMNHALHLIFGKSRPYVSQRKGEWYIDFPNGQSSPYFDNVIIGGGSGAAYKILN